MRRRLLAVPLLLAAAAGGAALFTLQSEGVTPRALAPYLLKRTSGHNALVEGGGRFAHATLLRLDRGTPVSAAIPALTVGAQPEPVPAAVGGRERMVASSAEALRALADAAPGDVITFLPGEYRFRGNVYLGRPGSAAAPIVVRAAQPHTVQLALDAAEGFIVAAPHWRFENLDIRGACRGDACQHAFHVTGGAHHFVARNNTITDFNAHFKINGARGQFPDHGLIESNTLGNSAPRQTKYPVTPIDLVGASDWIVRGNLIHDFIKTGGDRISYGAFAKGGAERTVFERNVLLCEARLGGHPGQRIGLSFGGGGTGKQYCRDGRCVTEHDGGIMRANLVAGCSDVGIYLNSAANTQVRGNTLLDTAGIQVRFPESVAQLDGNLVDGPVRAHDGASVRAGENLDTAVSWLYLGRHPHRALFADASRLDLRWADAAPLHDADGEPVPDLCGTMRGAQRAYGAFDNFHACLRSGKP